MYDQLCYIYNNHLKQMFLVYKKNPMSEAKFFVEIVLGINNITDCISQSNIEKV